MKKRVLVTGGAGFLGSHLCARLIEQECQVLCVDNYFTGTRRNIEALLDDPAFEVVRHDVTFPLYVEVDRIYNLACPASPIHYQHDPVQTTKTSVIGAINMLGLAKRLRARVLQASTSEVYGDPDVHPQTEQYRGHVNLAGPRGCYDEGKRCAETLFYDYRRQHKLSIRIARIFNTYGPNMHSTLKRLLTARRARIRSWGSPLVPRRVVVGAAASGTQEARRMSWARRLCTAWDKWQTHIFALADQAVVSGASFLTTVLIARWTYPSELGLYAIGISLLVSSLAVQESLISLPYTIQQNNPPGTRAEHAGSSLALCGLMSAVGIVVLALTAVALAVDDTDPRLVAMIWALAAAVPFALVREFGRQFAFAHLRTGQALILDAGVAAIQLAGLGWIGWTGQMSSAKACAVLGIACAVVAIAWLYPARRDFAIRREQIGPTMRQGWAIGKWLFANQITMSVQGYAACWLLAALAGTAATGVYAACMSVVLFANPLIMGLGNIMTPRSVLALQGGGGARLRLQVIRDSLLLGVAMTLFCLFALFAGEAVLQLLYHASPYEERGHTLTVLALAMLAMAVGMPASSALEGMPRPREVFWTGLFGAVVTIFLVWRLVPEWDVLGAAYGFFAGNAARSVARWIAFLALIPKPVTTPDSTSPTPSPRWRRRCATIHRRLRRPQLGN